MEPNVADERLQFVRDFKSGQWSMTELCERYGVTRPTGYKWVARHQAGGDRGLVERSRAPHMPPTGRAMPSKRWSWRRGDSMAGERRSC